MIWSFQLRGDIEMEDGAVRMKYDLEVDSMDVAVHQEYLHVILNIVDSAVSELAGGAKKVKPSTTPPPEPLPEPKRRSLCYQCNLW